MANKPEIKSVLQELSAMKEQTKLSEYPVEIIETLKMTVHIEAKSGAEAEAIVEAAWNNAEYILDSECFEGVEFQAQKPERDIGNYKGNEL